MPAYRLPSPRDVSVARGIELAETRRLGHLRRDLGAARPHRVRGRLGHRARARAPSSGLSRLGEALLAPSIAAVRAVPSLAWVPLLILYLGIGEDSKITLIAIGAVFPVFTTVAGALRHVDPQPGRGRPRLRPRPRRRCSHRCSCRPCCRRSCRGCGSRWPRRGCSSSRPSCIASSMGVGFLLTESQCNGRVDRMFLAIIFLALARHAHRHRAERRAAGAAAPLAVAPGGHPGAARGSPVLINAPRSNVAR